MIINKEIIYICRGAVLQLLCSILWISPEPAFKVGTCRLKSVETPLSMSYLSNASLR